MERGSSHPRAAGPLLIPTKLPRWVVSAPRRADNLHLPDSKQTLPFPRGWDTSCNPAWNGVTQLPASDPLFPAVAKCAGKAAGQTRGFELWPSPQKVVMCEEKIRVLAGEPRVTLSNI